MENRDTLPLSRYQEHYETQSGSLTKILSSGIKVSFGKSMIRLLCFDTRDLSVKHKTVPLQRFSLLWDEKFSKETGDTP